MKLQTDYNIQNVNGKTKVFLAHECISIIV